MTGEYRLGGGSKAFMYIVCTIIAGATLYWLAVLLAKGASNAGFIVIVPFLILAGVAWMAKQTNDYLLVIKANSMQLTDGGKTRELLFSEIAGYTVAKNNTLVKPTDADEPILKISKYTENYGGIQIWLQHTFQDLDKVEYATEEKEILSNPDFGQSKEERQQNLEKAKGTAKVVNGIGFALMFWAFIDPEPYELVCALCFIYPLIAFGIYRYYDGLLRVDPSKNNAYGDISGMAVVPFAILLRALFDYDFITYSTLWLPTIVLAAVITLVVVYKNKEATTATRQAFIILTMVVALVYSYAAMVFYNCYKDESGAHSYQVQIADKYTSGSKSTTYHFKVKHWGPDDATHTFTVDKALYSRCGIGKTIYINVRQGRLNASWYFVTD